MSVSPIEINIGELLHANNLGLQLLELSSSCLVYLTSASAFSTSGKNILGLDLPGLERPWIDRGHNLEIHMEIVADGSDLWRVQGLTNRLASSLESAEVVVLSPSQFLYTLLIIRCVVVASAWPESCDTSTIS